MSLTEAEIQSLCGGFPDHPNQPVVASMMGPPFAVQAAALMQTAYAAPTQVLLYKAWVDVIGSYISYPRQLIGDCVSFGHSHGYDLLQCVEIALSDPGIKDRPAKVAQADIECATEYVYAASRRAAGMLGSWSDGSFGSAAVKAMTTGGVAPRSAIGPYDGQRAKKWGHDGPPAELDRLAANYRLGGSALVRTWDELFAALVNGYPVTVCSNQGFTLQRDNEGFCAPRGSWGHCMLICGIKNGNRPGALIAQSWGDSMPSGPVALDQMTYSFWADKNVVESMLAAGDSWALSAAPYFVPRPIPAHWSFDEYVM